MATTNASASSASADLQELYQSLEIGADKNKMRLLYLHPRTQGSALEADLRLANLSQSPEYQALSYTWGQRPNSRRVLIINKKYRLPITDNLFDALHGLRKFARNRIIWVDAICINQSDDVEKGHQVANMGPIYKSAACVNIWLGGLPILYRTEPCPSRVETVLGWCRFAHKDTFLGKDTKWFTPAGFSFLGGLLRNFPGKIELAVASSSPAWHERMWIVQEFAMAQKSYLSFGSHRWRYREWCFSECYLYSTPSNFQILIDHLVDDLSTLSEEFNTGKRRVDLFEGSRALVMVNATDARDKVYSLAAFLDPQELNILQPDYSSPCWEVFARATFASIRSRGTFDILTLACSYRRDPSRRSQEQNVPDLPTWALDFVALNPTLSRYKTVHSVESIRRNSGTDQVASPTVELSPSNKHLTISGISAGHIRDLVDVGLRRNSSTINALLEVAVESAARSLQQDSPASACWLLKQYTEYLSLDPRDCPRWKERTHVPEHIDALGIQALFSSHPKHAIFFTTNETYSELFSTEDGLVGCMMGLCEPRIGDRIIIVDDPATVLILRPGDEHYTLVGIAYLQQQVTNHLWRDLIKAGFESQVEKFILC